MKQITKMINLEESKRCPRCEKTKPLTEYYGQKNSCRKPVYCKPCLREKDREPKSRFSSGKCKAKARSLDWSLTLEQYTSFLNSRCHYCAGPTPTSGTGIDRIDNAIGYTFDNVVPCCGVCNFLKHRNFSYEEMKQHIGPAVAAIRKMRNLGPDEHILMQHMIVDRPRREYRPRRTGGNSVNGYHPVRPVRDR